jgi:hypothetical protein
MFRLCGEIDGKDLKNEDRFCFSEYQRGQTIYAIQDVKKDFSFESIYNKITGKFIIEKKCKNKEVIPFDDAPKIILTSNFIPRNLEQESTKRRLVLLELENYYNSSFTPLDDFGNRFFYDWTKEEWAAFDAFMIKCVQKYMNNGFLQYQSANLSKKKILSNVNQSVVEWLEDKWIPQNRHELNGVTGFMVKIMWDSYQDSHKFYRYAPATRIAFTRSIMTYFQGGIVKKHLEKGDFVYVNLEECILFQNSDEKTQF